MSMGKKYFFFFKNIYIKCQIMTFCLHKLKLQQIRKREKRKFGVHIIYNREYWSIEGRTMNFQVKWLQNLTKKIELIFLAKFLLLKFCFWGEQTVKRKNLTKSIVFREQYVTYLSYSDTNNSLERIHFVFKLFKYVECIILYLYFFK